MPPLAVDLRASSETAAVSMVVAGRWVVRMLAAASARLALWRPGAAGDR